MSQGIVILAGHGDSTCAVFHRLDDEFGVAAVILEQSVPTTQLLRRRAEKLGVRAVVGQVLFKTTVEPLLRMRSRRRLDEIRREQALDTSPIPPSRLTRVPSVNAYETIAHLKELQPAVVVVNGTRIIAKRVLESVSAPFLNMHAGITPLYRGVHGGYWALVNGDASHCGVTVHVVDPGIDTGSVVGQSLIEPTMDDSFVTYPALQLAAGLPLLVEAVRAALEGGAVPSRPAPDGPSKLWSHPTLRQYVEARVRKRVR